MNLYIATYNGSQIKVTKHNIFDDGKNTVTYLYDTDDIRQTPRRALDKFMNNKVMSYDKDKATVLMKGYLLTKANNLKDRAKILMAAIDSYKG